MQFVEYIWKLRSWIAGLGYVSHLHNLKVKDNGGSTKAQTNPTETLFPVGKRKKRNAEKNLIEMVSRPKYALHVSETQLPLVRIASLLVAYKYFTGFWFELVIKLIFELFPTNKLFILNLLIIK